MMKRQLYGESKRKIDSLTAQLVSVQHQEKEKHIEWTPCGKFMCLYA